MQSLLIGLFNLWSLNFTIVDKLYITAGISKMQPVNCGNHCRGTIFVINIFPQIIMFNKFVRFPFHTFAIAVLSAIYPPSTHKQTISFKVSRVCPRSSSGKGRKLNLFNAPTSLPNVTRIVQNWFNSNTVGKLLNPLSHFLCLGMFQAPGNDSSLLLKERYLLEGMASWGLSLILF